MTEQIRRPQCHSPDQIRDNLLRKVELFTKLTGKTRTEIGLGSVNDRSVIGRIEGGSDFGLNLYGRILKYLEDNWPNEAKT